MSPTCTETLCHNDRTKDQSLDVIDLRQDDTRAVTSPAVDAAMQSLEPEPAPAVMPSVSPQHGSGPAALFVSTPPSDSTGQPSDVLALQAMYEKMEKWIHNLGW